MAQTERIWNRVSSRLINHVQYTYLIKTAKKGDLTKAQLKVL